MDKKRNIHFSGIGDVVMCELAIAMKQAGHQVSTSELSAPGSLLNENLQEAGLLPSPGWNPDKVTKSLDALIISPTIKRDNPELNRALELNIPVFSYAEFIQDVCKDKHRVVVTGSYGKTMVTVLILHVLTFHNRKVDFVVAKEIPGLKHSIRLSDAPLVIIEGQDALASTLDPTAIFLKYKHHIGLISGVEWIQSADYPTKAEYTKQFSQFETSTPKGGVLIYFDLEPVVTVLAKVNLPDILYIPYKTHASSNEGGQEFLVESSTEKHPLKLTGKHNLQNISAAKEAVKRLGITSSMFYEAIQSFGGKTI